MPLDQYIIQQCPVQSLQSYRLIHQEKDGKIMDKQTKELHGERIKTNFDLDAYFQFKKLGGMNRQKLQ